MPSHRPARAPLLRIGQLARATGLSPDTLRHYSRVRVLPVERRTGSGYREYSADAIRRVRTIQVALAMGFTLKELTSLFAERAAGRPPCARARQLAQTKLDELERQLDQLSRLRSSLGAVLAAWDEQLRITARGEPARLLESLGDTPIDVGARPRSDTPPSKPRWRSQQSTQTRTRNS